MVDCWGTCSSWDYDCLICDSFGNGLAHKDTLDLEARHVMPTDITNDRNSVRGYRMDDAQVGIHNGSVKGICPARFSRCYSIETDHASLGSYGAVYVAVDEYGYRWAMKKHFEVNEDFQPLIREIYYCSIMHHNNVISIVDMQPSTDGLSFYTVMERMQGDIAMLICNSDNILIQRVKQQTSHMIMQVLKGLDHMHGMGVVHRDIKPNNILFRLDAGKIIIKIGDLGMACLADYPTMEIFTGEVGPIAYNPPEVLFTEKRFAVRGKGVDMWSVGMLMLDLLLMRMFFCPRIEDVDPFQAVVNRLTAFFPIERGQITCGYRVRGQCSPYVGLGSLFDMLDVAKDPIAIDLIGNLMHVDTRSRFSVQKAMDHPYFSVCREEQGGGGVKEGSDSIQVKVVITMDWEHLHGMVSGTREMMFNWIREECKKRNYSEFTVNTATDTLDYFMERIEQKVYYSQLNLIGKSILIIASSLVEHNPIRATNFSHPFGEADITHMISKIMEVNRREVLR